MKTRIVPVIVVFLLAAAGGASADKAASSNRKGVEAYNAKRYEESLNRFTDALIERPNAPELHFNRGTALSALGKKDDAVRELSSAASEFKAKDLSAGSYYNAGNTLFAAEDFKGALEWYKTAVKLDQKSGDIRYNLELAARKLTEQKKQPSDKDTRNKDDQKNDQKKNKTPKNKQQQQKMEQQQSQNQNSDVKPMTK